MNSRRIKSRLRVVASSALLLAALGCGEGEVALEKPPHILLISIDTLRADHLGTYGYERDTSPFLDELATGGLKFENAFINTLGTTPSHATLLSGLYQETHRVEYALEKGELPDSPIPEAVVQIQELLSASGYQTLAVTDGGRIHSRYGFSRGFETYVDRGRGIARGGNLFLQEVEKRLFGTGTEETGTEETAAEETGAANRSAEEIHGQTGTLEPDDRPIFAFYHTYEVHSPYRTPPEYQGLYTSGESTFEPTSPNLLEVIHTVETDLTDADMTHIKARYDEGIRYADDRLRAMFERLREIGFLDNTLVILTSDHGEEFGEHGAVLHGGTLYEELLKVPLLLSGHGVQANAVEQQLVSLVDVAPTVLAAAGVEVPASMPGRDLLSLPPVPTAKQRVFAQFRSWRYGIRTPTHKLILTHYPRQRAELFDLLADPAEQVNLFKEQPDLAQSLTAELDSWIAAESARSLASEAELELDEEARRQLEALGYVGN